MDVVSSRVPGKNKSPFEKGFAEGISLAFFDFLEVVGDLWPIKM